MGGMCFLASETLLKEKAVQFGMQRTSMQLMMERWQHGIQSSKRFPSVVIQEKAGSVVSMPSGIPMLLPSDSDVQYSDCDVSQLVSFERSQRSEAAAACSTKLTMLFVANNPLLLSTLYDVQFKCLASTLLYMAQIAGTLAVTVFTFEYDGAASVHTHPKCAQKTLYQKFVRGVSHAALSSVFATVVPMCLAIMWKRHFIYVGDVMPDDSNSVAATAKVLKIKANFVKKLARKDKMMYVICFFYLALCCFCVALFMASVNSDEHVQLLFAVVFSLLLRFLFAPAAKAFGMWLVYITPHLIDSETSSSLVTRKAQERLTGGITSESMAVKSEDTNGESLNSPKCARVHEKDTNGESSAEASANLQAEAEADSAARHSDTDEPEPEQEHQESALSAHHADSHPGMVVLNSKESKAPAQEVSCTSEAIDSSIETELHIFIAPPPPSSAPPPPLPRVPLPSTSFFLKAHEE